MDSRNFRHTDASSQKTQSSSSSSQDLEDEKIDPRQHRPSPWKRMRVWIVMLSTLIVFALVLGLSLGLTLDHKQQCNATCGRKYPIVDLGYAKYQGTSSPAGIKQWLGMRYAAPPVGDLRFAAPQDPVKEDKIIKANKFMPHCLSTKAKLIKSPMVPSAQEDCLFLDVYAPDNATDTSRLPVFFYIQGGGFNGNANPNLNGTSLMRASGMNMIFVTHNYRVGPYGFLASKEIAKDGSLNNGLKDQRKALEWVQDHITKFGGDPARVTMGGSSAGGASITLQLAAYGGRDDKLFHQAAAESQSFAAVRTVEESQYQYDELVKRVKCNDSDDTLACLREVPIASLQYQNINTPFPGQQRNPTFSYNPTLDHDFLTDVTIALFQKGKFVNVPTIYGDANNEGSIFAPRNTDSKDASNKFFTASFPKMSKDMLDEIQGLYSPSKFPTLPSYESGQYWRSTYEAYGDIRYVCPGFQISNQYSKFFSKNNKVWNYHYNVSDPKGDESGYGVAHVAEMQAIFASAGGPLPLRKGGINHDAIRVMQGYWTSFIRFGDPNVARASGTSTWENWGGADAQKRLLINRGGVSSMETNPPEVKARCERIGRWAVEIAQ